MAVSVKILNKTIDKNKPEYQAALVLKSLMEKSFSENINGSIGIAYGLTLCGQAVRDIDLLMFGKLENYSLPQYYTNNAAYHKKNLKVDAFCIVIELKEHPLNRVDFQGTHFYVDYNGSWKDATDQNEEQRYACANYLEASIGQKIFATNFLWLKTLTKEQLKAKTKNAKVGALPSNFSFKDIVEVIIDQGMEPYFVRDDQCYHLNPNRDIDIYDEIKKNIFVNRLQIQGLTRQKLEVLMQKKVDQRLENINSGENLTIVKGRAGTGKTFFLIETALKLANSNTGKRCLLLTYNHALVSDIRRLLHFMEIPDGIDNYTIQIKTLHSFFMQLMKTLGISTSNIFDNQFDSSYKKALDELLGYVEEAMNKKDIQTLKEDNELAIDWDYILIDEAQDWSDAEKKILFKIYGQENIIVADGVDQFIRENQYQHWSKGTDAVKIMKLETGMRQKTNLVNFVNAFAAKLGLKWSVKSNPQEQWNGGEVMIMNAYDSGTHEKLLDECKKAGGDSYDMLFLVPYQMAPHRSNTSEKIKPIDVKTWSEAGIKLFDGTNKQKEQYSINTDECRLYQYDSCRGLEGWATICFKFDVLIANKLKLAKQMDSSEDLELRSKEEREKAYAYLWSLMPLTRAIDTLVITLDDPNSEVGRILKEMAFGDFSDIITWQCN